MLRIDKQEVFPEIPGVTVWGDDKAAHIFYVLPESPRFRLVDGKPVFKFIKYRAPVSRPDGLKGGYIFFDAEIAVPEASMKQLEGLLQDRINKRHQEARRPGAPPKVQFGTITYTRGSVRMLLEQDGKVIQTIKSAGKPTLFGNNVASFALELTQDGTAIFEAAMQGEGASAISLVYDLYFWTKLPTLSAHVWFNSDKFYSYIQSTDTEVSWWSEDHYREDLREFLKESESGGSEITMEFALSDPEQDRKIKDRLRDWAQRTLEDTLTRAQQQALAPLTEDQRKVPEKVLEDLGGDDLDNMWRNIQTHKVASFDYWYRENSATEWNLAPQGTLPALTTLKGKDGKPLDWKQYMLTIDGDDEFFKQLNVAVQVNADFAALPLHSVEVHLEYVKANGKKDIAEHRFSSPNDVGRFAAYIDNNNWKYKYWYEVNFRGSARTFKSPEVVTDEPLLTINLDQTGILAVDIVPGDLDFEQIRAAQVTIKYEDKENQVPLVQQAFIIDERTTQHRFQKVIFKPQNKPYEYQVKYLMRDGREILGPWTKDSSSPLIVNDIFGAMRSVQIRATGNLNELVEMIFVELGYSDPANKITLTKSVALDQNEPAVEWSFPVADLQAGTITYSGQIKYFDGTEEPIAETTTTKNLITVGPSVRSRLVVDVLPDFMFDDPDVRLVRVSLNYSDGAGVDARKDFTFRSGDTEPQQWVVDLKDKTKTSYTWTATFFMIDGSQRRGEPETTDALTLIPQLAPIVG